MFRLQRRFVANEKGGNEEKLDLHPGGIFSAACRLRTAGSTRNGNRTGTGSGDRHLLAYAYGLEYGQALNDVMGTEYGDTTIDVTKDGAEFLGWTLYVADEITWSRDEVYDTEILCLPYNDAGSQGMNYALLENGSLVGEYMPTE